MSTSNTFTFTLQLETLLNDAASFLGFLGEGDILSASEFSLGTRVSNYFIKNQMVKNIPINGMLTFQRQIGYLFLNSNSGAYTLSATSPYWCNTFITTTSSGNNAPSQNVLHLSNTTGISTNTTLGIILDTNVMQFANVVSSNATAVVLNATLQASVNTSNALVYVIQQGAQPPQFVSQINIRDSNGNDVYVENGTYEQYIDLPGKANPSFTGIPSFAYVENHLYPGSAPYSLLYTDVAGTIDLTRYLVVYYGREIDDLVNPTDEIAMPKEWYRALIFGVARDWAPHFPMPWTPQQEKLFIEAWKLATNSNRKIFSGRFSRRKTPGPAIWSNTPSR